MLYRNAYWVKVLCALILIMGTIAGSVGIAQTTGTTAPEENEELGNVVTVHAEDAELASILSLLAEKSGYNIVTGPDVNAKDKISLHLVDVPINQAVNLVVRAAGLSYEIVGSSFLVASKTKLKEEVGIGPNIIHLKYANAAEVANFLTNLTEEISVDSTGNNLLVNSSPKILDEIRNIVEQIDVPAIQIMLEARLIEVAVSDEEQLGIDWSKLSKLTTIMAETGEPPYPGAGSLVPGVSFQNFQGALRESYSPLPTGEVPQEMYFQRISGFDNIGHFSRQLTAFDLTLDFLMKHNKAEILANSQVVTLNGRAAQISMVDIVPYILSAGGVGGQVQVRREEVGIKLDILPTVNKDGYITTKVTPEVSSIFEFIGPDKNIPWVKKRISTTTIRVKDNETIVIAGLLGVDRKTVRHRVPILGSLPWVGTLFRHKNMVDQKTDLVIQVTPHVIKDNYTGIDKTPNIQMFEQSVREKSELEKRQLEELQIERQEELQEQQPEQQDENAATESGS
ncbi:MAG: Type IV pilus biogenesis and competence protein PilQ [Candidatus Marinimicrobia bacterium]|nr:Type IV pilus biogenesis and competence protein PilQ [Candidatus Neomarinimicrobiota bacterium]